MSVDKEASSSKEEFIVKENLFSSLDTELNKYEDIFGKINSGNDNGYNMIKRLDGRVLSSFFVTEKSLKAFQENFAIVTSIIDRHVKTSEKFLQEYCEEHELSLEILENSEESHHREICQMAKNPFVLIEITLEDYKKFLTSLSLIFSLICAFKMDNKSDFISDYIIRSYKIPMIEPFPGFSYDLFFNQLGVTYNTKFFSELNSLPSVSSKADYMKNNPIFFANGNLLVICKRGVSRGTNSNGNTFNVLNLVEPSLSILQRKFMSYIRTNFSQFTIEFEDVNNLFMNLSESQNVNILQCLRSDPNYDKNTYLAMVNLKNIYFTYAKSKIILLGKLWVNLLLKPI